MTPAPGTGTGNGPGNDNAFIITASGIQFFPLAPRVEDVRLADIAHALSHLCRFNGHVREFYSVAQHSCGVAAAMQRAGARMDALREALLHDAAEAYLGDMVRPLKRATPSYCEAETRLLGVIHRAFWIRPSHHAVVNHWDNVLLATEIRDLMPAAPEGVRWTPHRLPEPLDLKTGPIKGQSPEEARRTFLAFAASLYLYDRQSHPPEQVADFPTLDAGGEA